MLITVLADTHLRASNLDGLPTAVVTAVRDADVLLHAGDLVSLGAYRELAKLTKTYAVLGNNDHELRGVLRETVLVDLDGLRVGMVHDAGQRTGRGQRLRARFPTADIVVYGHSHVPSDEFGVDGQLLFNPGSPTQRRAQPACTFGRLVIDNGQLMSRTIEIVPPSEARNLTH